MKLKRFKNVNEEAAFEDPMPASIPIPTEAISDVIAYAGYHTSASGTPLVFSFIVNNYDGSSSVVRQKIYRVLNALK